MLKIWGRLNSVNVQKVVWCADELGLAYARIDAGREHGVVGTPEYRAMNPNGLIPVIEDDGFVLWESNAIVRYLAAKHGLGTLCPADPAARADADRWMDWQATALNPAIGRAFVQLVRTAPADRNAAEVEAGRVAAEQKLALLDAHLATRDYLGGAAFTMADIPAGCSVDRWSKLPIERTPRPNVERWLARLRSRAGMRQVADLAIS
ncbi:MAG: glutathione S-transferase N-terminal domain-containing protein [Betaproteobacteria bacterium]|nr:glutathione S-transferase N-terminal domain-containing protein [Betaproteobacteria bacterium]